MTFNNQINISLKHFAIIIVILIILFYLWNKAYVETNFIPADINSINIKKFKNTIKHLNEKISNHEQIITTQHNVIQQLNKQSKTEQIGSSVSANSGPLQANNFSHGHNNILQNPNANIRGREKQIRDFSRHPITSFYGDNINKIDSGLNQNMEAFNNINLMSSIETLVNNENMMTRNAVGSSAYSNKQLQSCDTSNHPEQFDTFWLNN